jgi:hypothetical protein
MVKVWEGTKSWAETSLYSQAAQMERFCCQTPAVESLLLSLHLLHSAPWLTGSSAKLLQIIRIRLKCIFPCQNPRQSDIHVHCGNIG